MENTIPKIIHYCWFGNNEKPYEIKKYMKTWKILDDYKVIEWNEKNSNLNSSEYIKKVYSKKKWAFVSDYIRLKALYEYGGIYLDTDVEIKKKFDNLLNEKLFLGFIFDCSIGTAVIGAVPKHPIIKELLDLYEGINYANDSLMGYTHNEFPNIRFVNNNDLFTIYLLNRYPQFRLNNKKQELGDITIYPKETFEIEPLIGRGYCIHRCCGSWKKNKNQCKDENYEQHIKYILKQIPRVDAIITHIKYHKRLPRLPFYKQYLEHKLKK